MDYPLSRNGAIMPNMESDEQTDERVPFQRKTDAKATDAVSIHIVRQLRDQLEEERDRIDPPRDSFNRKRRQQGIDKFAEALLMYGLQQVKSVPDWKDPMNLSNGSVH